MRSIRKTELTDLAWARKDLLTVFAHLQIKSDTDRHKDHIHILISKVEAATFIDILEVETFVKWIDEELSSLVDERAVLKHFPKWPERKADSLREAACNYKRLKNLESEISSFKDNPKDSLTQALQRIQSLQDRRACIKNIITSNVLILTNYKS